jgi:uncharacterized protein (TIGR03085 family)
MTSYAQAERHALTDLFLEVGPDAPTLCEGWATRDLAAHLVLRETRPDAAVGILVRPLAHYTEEAQRGIRARPWPKLVEAVRSGPPVLLRPVDEAFNTVEYFVHHEDVRRATDGWDPRPLEPGLEAALWRRLKTMTRPMFRRAGVVVDLEAPGYGQVKGGRGDDHVRLTGTPGELLLLAFGRGDHVRVQREGTDAALDRLASAKLGF